MFIILDTRENQKNLHPYQFLVYILVTVRLQTTKQFSKGTQNNETDMISVCRCIWMLE